MVAVRLLFPNIELIFVITQHYMTRNEENNAAYQIPKFSHFLNVGHLEKVG